MSLKSFKEYLDEKGNLVEPKTEKVPDFHGKIPSAPNKAEKIKTKAGDDQSPAPKPQKPYSNPSKDSKNYSFKNIKDTGLAEKGNKEISKMPNTEKKVNFGDVQSKEPFPKGSSQKKKIKTENIVKAINKMDSRQFVEFMAESCGCMGGDGDALPTVTAYAAGKFHPHPPEVINYIVSLSEKNNSIINQLVDEINKKGLLKEFMESIMEVNDCYSHMASLFEDQDNGPVRSRMFVKAMDDGFSKFQSDLYESVSSPIGFDNDHGDEGNNDDGGGKESKISDLDKYDHHHDDDNDDGGDEEKENDDFNDPSEGDDETHGGLDTQDLNVGNDDLDGNEHSDEHESDGSDKFIDKEQGHKPMDHDKKIKRKFAEDHLIGSMIENDRLKNKIKGFVG